MKKAILKEHKAEVVKKYIEPAIMKILSDLKESKKVDIKGLRTLAEKYYLMPKLEPLLIKPRKQK